MSVEVQLVTRTRPANRFHFSFSRIMAFITLLVIALVTVYPFVWMVLTSLRDRTTVFTGPFIPEQFIFSNYPQAFEQTQFAVHFLNTLLIAGGSLVGILFLSTTAGYAFAKLNFPFKNIIYVLLLSTMAMPAASLIIPLYLQLKSIGLLNSQFGLILVYVGSMSPFSIFLMRSFYETVPNELIEAARMDGSSEWGTLYRVVLPLVRPGIGTVVILQFLALWNEFLYATVLLQSADKQPLQPAIFNLIGQYSTNWTLLAASLTMAIAPIVIVYVNMQKQFVSGLTQGALKW
ncbi:MAG TPA: carbohydrate ABC transporter permease [Anaerolineaceae bacterium]|jgi:ABC-type glycerol-3-phosphate transport system permease component